MINNLKTMSLKGTKLKLQLCDKYEVIIGTEVPQKGYNEVYKFEGIPLVLL